MEDEKTGGDIHVHAFDTIEEIKNHPGFRENNGVHKGNYKDLIGHYRFADEVKCCFQKDNGNLCGEDHKFGFVAILSDNSITIVGNNCAQEKFGADAKIKIDSGRYLKEQKRREKLAGLHELLKVKDARLADLQSFRARASVVKDWGETFLSSLGDQTVRGRAAKQLWARPVFARLSSDRS